MEVIGELAQTKTIAYNNSSLIPCFPLYKYSVHLYPTVLIIAKTEQGSYEQVWVKFKDFLVKASPTVFNDLVNEIYWSKC